jgi:hypothetical protein
MRNQADGQLPPLFRGEGAVRGCIFADNKVVQLECVRANGAGEVGPPDAGMQERCDVLPLCPAMLWHALQATTRIKYVTDGLLLREMMDDPLLTRYR